MTGVSNETQENEGREIPAWLLGLLIAAVLFVIGLFVFQALGFGDDPVLQEVVAPVVLLARWPAGRAMGEPGD